MRWGDYIKRTAVRRVVWVVMGVMVYAALSLVGVSKAQDFSGCGPEGPSDAYCPDIATAVSNAQQRAQNYLDGTTNPDRREMCGPIFRNSQGQVSSPGDASLVTFRVTPSGGTCAGSTWSHTTVRRWSEGCPAGTEWRDDLNRCFDPSECLARNQQAGFNVPTVATYSDECVDGCAIRMDPSQGYTCSTVLGVRLCSGNLEWSGDSCTRSPTEPPVDPPPAEPPPQACTPAGSGQSFCIKPNGQNCYTASTGRQICWNPNETGDKPDGNTLQKRNAGDTEIPPANPNLPTGDTLQKKGESVTTTTTTTNSGGSTTSTTTTTNYETVHGTSPKPGTPDQGEPGDGTGADGGQGDEETGSIDGGGDCESPPIGRGGDAQLVAVVNQAWATRCAVEAGNAAKVTGDVADCQSNFTVEGTNANAVKLRAMREQICGENARGEREGISSGLDAEINSMLGQHETIWGEGADPGAISTTRYGGGGSCPVIEVTIPIINRTWTPPPQFCSVIAGLRLLFIAITTVWALRIIGD